jgi:hypothetical protein
MFYEADLLNLNDADEIFSEQERSYLESLTVKKNFQKQRKVYIVQNFLS